MTNEIIGNIITGLFGLGVVYVTHKLNKKVSNIDNKVAGVDNKVGDVDNKISKVQFDVQEVRKEQIRNKNRDISILVLDDDEDDLKIVESIVKKTGKKYELFTNEDIYISKLNDEANIHIIDHFLSKMSGLQILREIKRRNELNFVIAYTGTKNDQTIIDYTNGGVNRFIDKNNPDHLQQLAMYLNDGIRVTGR